MHRTLAFEIAKHMNKSREQSAEEKRIKNVWNIFKILNAFHIASTRLRVVILHDVERNGKKIIYIYIYLFSAAEPGTISIILIYII